jgi:hypothetical protein
MGVLQNRRLEIFAQALALGKSTYDAAREAGYNTDAPSFEANARQRAAKVEVKQRVLELQQRSADRVTIDRAWLMSQLAEIAGVDTQSMEVNTAHKLKALELIAKVQGLFAPEKREVIARLAELDIEQLRALDQRLSEAEQDEQPDAEDLH